MQGTGTWNPACLAQSSGSSLEVTNHPTMARSQMVLQMPQTHEPGSSFGAGESREAREGAAAVCRAAVQKATRTSAVRDGDTRP